MKKLLISILSLMLLLSTLATVFANNKANNYGNKDIKVIVDQTYNEMKKETTIDFTLKGKESNIIVNKVSIGDAELQSTKSVEPNEIEYQYIISEKGSTKIDVNYSKVVREKELEHLVHSFTVDTISIAQAQAVPQDISNLIAYKTQKVNLPGGEGITDENVFVGTAVEIYLEFDLDLSKHDLVEGDFFKIPLFETDYFFKEDIQSRDFYATGGQHIGTYSIIGNIATVTINENGAEHNSLFDGFLYFSLKATKEGTSEKDALGGSKYGKIKILPKTGTPPGIPEDDAPFPDERKDFYKTGKQRGEDDVINWSVLVNWRGLDSIMQSVLSGKNGEEVNVRERMVLIDTLPEGLKFKADSLYVTTPIQRSSGDGKMGVTPVLNTNNIQLQSLFVEIKPQENETLELFIERIRNYNEYSFGIYTDTQGNDTVIVGFGDSPGKRTYDEVFASVGAKSVIELIEADPDIPTAKKTIMKTIYATNASNKYAGKIASYSVGFDTDVMDLEIYGNSTFNNAAKLIWSENGHEEDNEIVEYVRYGLGISVDLDFLSSYKRVTGTGAMESPRAFEFVLVDENDITKAYGKTGIITEKGKKYELVWYTDESMAARLENGKKELGFVPWNTILEDGVRYTIKEINAGGWTLNDSKGKNSFVYRSNRFLALSVDFENVMDEEKVNIAVNKTWDDNNNQDGIRPDEITVILKADGIEVGRDKVNNLNNWALTFTDLPKYSGGVAIVYTLEEVNVADYVSEITKNSDDNFTIKNTHTPEKINLAVNKTWDDNNNQDGIRPDEITVILKADGIEVGRDKVNNLNNWALTFTDLPKYSGGVAIVYTLEEVNVADYVSEITKNSDDNFTIKNTHTPEKINLAVNKTWDDNNNQDGIRPDEITVILKANDVEVGRDKVNNLNNWALTFTDLPKYSGGVAIVYTLEEVSVADYVSEITKNSDDSFTIKNTHTPEKVNIAVNKTWDDNNNQDGIRPDEITVILKADGIEVGRDKVNNLNNWALTFTDLPKYSGGVAIVYTLEEVSVADYVSEITKNSDDNFTIKNTHTPEKVNLAVNKTWDDNNNQDGIRPDEITVILKGNDVEVARKQANNLNNWALTFTDLPKYSGGIAIVYTLEEVNVADYVSEITKNSDDSFTIKNTHTPKKETEPTTTEPTTITEEPTTVTEEPTTVTEEPTTVTEEPTTVTEEPTTVTEEPTTVTEETTTGAGTDVATGDTFVTPFFFVMALFSAVGILISRKRKEQLQG